MNFTIGLIAAVGGLVAISLFFIAMDPGYILEPPVKPVACTAEYAPVCGVDGITYGNICTLDTSGILLDYTGECVEKSMPILSTNTISIPQGVSYPGCETANECYLPYSLEIQVGDTVSWINDDTAAHTVSSGNPAEGLNGMFDSGLFMAGTIFEYRFDEAGTYPYFCMVHPWMIGEIIVNEIKETTVNEIIVEPVVEEPITEPVVEEPITEPVVEEPITEPVVEESAPVEPTKKRAAPEVIMANGSGAPGCETTNECFIPYQVEISPGETVVWINSDSAAHTVTSGPPAVHNGLFDSGMLMSDQTWEYVFAESGEYDYHCMLHPWMTGKVIVK